MGLKLCFSLISLIAGRMKNNSKEAEWEGFETIQENIHLHPTLPLPDLPALPPPPSPPPLPTHPQPQNIPISKESATVPQQQPPSCKEPQVQPAKDTSIKRLPTSKQQEKTGAGEGKGLEGRKYDRIPIHRFEEECRYAGRVVYKGFVPRTSDNYMRLLREVDWKGWTQKKREVRNLHGVEFNSQFEGGNLNLAIQGGGERVRSLHAGGLQHRRTPPVVLLQPQERTQTQGQVAHLPLSQRMKPYVRSRRAAGDWRPAGDNVAYHLEDNPNDFVSRKDRKTYVLSFSYTFEHENDQVFFAAGIPYTYTFLQRQLTDYQAAVARRDNLIFEVGSLGRTMCGLDLQVITVEHRMAALVHDRRRKFVIINARTHSGETPSSWVLDGCLKELIDPEVEEWLFSSNVCLKIVPMLNPDGVFIGNYRTGIMGDDFNRKFSTGRREYYPQIVGLKKLVAACRKEGEVELFLDLHGHSILKNSFIYGPSQLDTQLHSLRTLPYHLAQNSKYFRLASCKFRTDATSIQTARVYFQMREQILSLTCENSLGLYCHKGFTMQMLAGDWQSFGRTLMQSIRQASLNKELKIDQSLPSTKAVAEIQRKLDGSQKSTKFLGGKGKQEKVYFRLPTSNVSIKQLEKTILEPIDRFTKAISFSQPTINREDDVFDMKQHSFVDKPKKEEIAQPASKLTFKIRRKSEVMKNPNPIQRPNNQHSQETKEKSNDKDYAFPRSLTSDQHESIRHDSNAQSVTKLTEDSPSPLPHMTPINENFSDEYCSINDSDSSCEDLPEQERRLLLDYIKSTQQRRNLQESGEEEGETGREKAMLETKGNKISRFREIRFKSIEELYAKGQGESPKKEVKKLRVDSQKFKETVSRSLINRLGEVSFASESEDPAILPISQQKKLNERTNQARRGQRDPFVLIQRKEKTHERRF